MFLLHTYVSRAFKSSPETFSKEIAIQLNSHFIIAVVTYLHRVVSESTGNYLDAMASIRLK